MSFEVIKAEIGMLLSQLVDRPHDRHELEIMLRAKLDALKAFNLPLPDDLAGLEAMLERELALEARQRTRHLEQPPDD